MITRSRNPRVGYVGSSPEAVLLGTISSMEHNSQLAAAELAIQMSDIRVPDFSTNETAVVVQKITKLHVTDRHASDLSVLGEHT